MMNRQLELEIGHACAPVPANIPRHRRNRAHWWFHQMRQVVDRALDWQPAREPRTGQLWPSDREAS